MGRKTKKFINKNDKSSFTFNLIHPDNRDPRLRSGNLTNQDIAAAGDEENHEYLVQRIPITINSKPATSVLQRVTPKNALKKGKVNIELPKNLCEALTPEYFGIHENLPVTELVNLSNNVYGSKENFPDSVKKKIAECTKANRLSQHSLSDEILETADCYFPLDGYDYEQHLRVMRPECIRSAVGGTPIQQAAKQLSTEEDEVLKALENAEEYDGLSDETVREVLEGANESLLLWGSANEMDKTALRSTDEKEAIQRLLLETRDYDTLSGGDELSENDELYSILEEEYKEDEIGELEETVVTNATDPNHLKAVLNQFHQESRKKHVSVIVPGGRPNDEDALNLDNKEAPRHDIEPLDEDERNKILETLQRLTPLNEMTSSCSSESDQQEDERWDCQTILSTRSNLENRPGRIQKPCRGSGVLPAILEKLIKTNSVGRVLYTTREQLENIEEESLSTTSEHVANSNGNSTNNEDIARLPAIPTKRLPGETLEEKRARKAAVKQAKRLIRQSKKEIAAIHKNEEKKRKEIELRSQDTHYRIRHIRL